ncbi:MAG: acyl carrier protein [Desulfobacteraceae bacterium]|nr:acyl carrier protein [Desulfobacteraceae bacterium]
MDIQNTQKLRTALKHLIIGTLKLEDITIEEISDDAPLFRDGLGLDSIDALELVVALEKKYGIIIENEDVGRRAFASVAALAAFVKKERTKLPN